MQTINDLEKLNEMKTAGPLLIMFGGKNCGVCQVVKPQLSSLLEEQFPNMQAVYVDCHLDSLICAQNSIFTLPVIQVYFEGIKIIEEIKVFSINGLIEKIKRPYDMWNDNQ